MPEGMLEIGAIGKPHGLRGEVVVRLVTNRLERMAPGTILDSDRGPLEIVSSRPHQGKYLVHFVGVVSREGAEELRGVTLRAEPIADESELWVHELVGRGVVDVDGIDRGSVESVLANPASDLLVLDTGHLVPLAFVVNTAEGRITIDAPDGLFDLIG